MGGPADALPAPLPAAAIAAEDEGEEEDKEGLRPRSEAGFFFRLGGWCGEWRRGVVLEKEEEEELDEEEGVGVPVAALRKKRLMEVWEDIFGVIVLLRMCAGVANSQEVAWSQDSRRMARRREANATY